MLKQQEEHNFWMPVNSVAKGCNDPLVVINSYTG